MAESQPIVSSTAASSSRETNKSIGVSPRSRRRHRLGRGVGREPGLAVHRHHLGEGGAALRLQLGRERGELLPLGQVDAPEVEVALVGARDRMHCDAVDYLFMQRPQADPFMLVTRYLVHFSTSAFQIS